MARTYPEICDLIEAITQDAGIGPGGSVNQVFSRALTPTEIQSRD